jgi:thiol-disulfide isomerase/thioredoxin
MSIEDKSVLTLYHAGWCGHCVTFQPKWEKIQAMVESKKMNGELISCVDYKEELYPQVIKDNNIKVFPTITITRNGAVSEYRGDYDLNPIMLAFTGPGQYGGRIPIQHNLECNCNQCSLKSQYGGSSHVVDPYKQKYLKYKQKYLDLKNNM